MSSLTLLLSKLKESGSDRVLFTPNDPGQAGEGDARRPLAGAAVSNATILEVVSDVLSQDDLQGLSGTRPRVVRLEHDGEDFVLEIARHPQGIALGIRTAARAARGLRDTGRREAPDSSRSEKEGSRERGLPSDSSRNEKEEPRRKPSRALEASSPTRPGRPSKRMRPPEGAAKIPDKRTIRAVVDEEGNLVGPGVPPGIAIRELDAPGADPGEPGSERPGPPRREARDDSGASPEEREVPVLDAEALGAIVREAVKELADVVREAARAITARAPAPEAPVASPHEKEARAGEADAGRPAPALQRSPAAHARLDGLLREMMQRKASDLHLSAGATPVFRVDGAVHFAPERPVLASSDVLEMMHAIITPRAHAELSATRDADFAYEIPGVARFRVNVFEDRHGTGAVLRRIPIEILSAEQLGLPKACLDLCWLSKGLVLVTGPTGSGKSTTLAAMIDFINKNRADHIITIEDPVEFTHRHKKCMVNQREVGADTHGFGNSPTRT